MDLADTDVMIDVQAVYAVGEPDTSPNQALHLRRRSPVALAQGA
jgi:hypothetical protein